MNTVRLFIGSTIFGVAAMAPAAPAQPVVAACTPTQMQYVASTEARFRLTSSDYVDLPQTKMIIHQGGTRDSCVLVHFSANAHVTGRDTVLVRAVLNEVTTAFPSELQISDGEDDGPNAHRFTFVFDRVPPGDHAIRIQYAKFGPGSADMNAHNTIVWYAR